MEHVGLYLYVDINAVANGGNLQLHVRRDCYNINFKIKQVMLYSLRVKHPHPYPSSGFSVRICKRVTGMIVPLKEATTASCQILFCIHP